MAKKLCYRCKEEKTLAHYISAPNSMYGGNLPICRECLASQIANTPAEQKWNTVDKICQWANVPFVPEEWEKIYQGHGKDALGVYFSIFRDQRYRTLQWDEYNNVYIQLYEENRVEDALPALKEKRKREMKTKWGYSYDEEELEYLENLHQGLLNSQNVVGALNEDQALKLCKISLIIEEKIREGVDFSKELKAYDELAKLSNLTPKNVKEANEFDSFGEVFAYLEKTGTQIEYYDNVNRDEVDLTIKDIKNWLKYLYVNETGVAEEIEKRIELLKAAAQAEDEDFDEMELRNYIEEQVHSELDEDEEFKISLDGEE